MKRFFVLTIILSLILFSSVFSQNYAGKIGLMFATNSSMSYSNIGFSYWVNNNVSLEPTFGFYNQSVSGNSSTMMAPGARIIFHMSTNKLKPYIGGAFNAFMSTTDSDTYTDMMISGLYGAEYFLTKWFSIGGEFRIDVIMANKDNPVIAPAAEATVIKTANTIILRFYLK